MQHFETAPHNESDLTTFLVNRKRGRGFYFDSVHQHTVCSEFFKSNYGTFPGILMGSQRRNKVQVNLFYTNHPLLYGLMVFIFDHYFKEEGNG